ncbi:MAG TPA: OadG family protein [Candidatus Blautia stercoravium]|nr:OadG family protein [Candidatus Blautia stercoravium]
MKQRWKKIGSLVSIGVLVFSLSACGQTKDEINSTVQNNLYQTTVATVQSLVQYDKDTMEQSMEENPNMDDFTKNAFVSWGDSSKELGAFKEFKETTPEKAVKKDGNQYVITLQAEFENRDATVEMVYDGKLNAESVGFSANYTMGEKMESAVMNAIVGLATVFIMLIFLSFVISLMKYVPKLEAALTKKKGSQAAPAPVPVPVQEALPEAEEELADDGALVAVIAAAIAAAENTSTDSFVVRSIRKSKKRSWK